MLRIEPSRLLRAWWFALHSLLALSVALLGWGWIAVLLWLAIALHARYGCPRVTIPLLVERDGAWSVPSKQLYDLRLGPDTSYSYEWASLRLESQHRGDVVRVLLLRDQLERDAWRRLQQRLRA